jgi:hypothetical protein
VGSDPNVERYNPDWSTDEFAFLNQPGQIDIQTELLTTTAPMWNRIRNNRHGCESGSHGFW